MTEQPNAITLPSRIGQGTAVEQSRAVAEVQSAIVVAQQCPRNIPAAIAEMEASCSQKMLADRAFYRFNRGGESGNVNGATVHLARELARCWGNVQYGLVEMRRDDAYGQSELQAWAWDVQTNTRVSTTFIVPHKRYSKKDGFTALMDMRDVYENNANNGARRVREMIFSVLPPWFVETAKELCNGTLEHGGGVPLPKRIADGIKGFEGIGVTVDQLETKFGPSGKWTAHTVAQLGIIYTSIQRGETSKDEEFPPPAVTTQEILASAAGQKGDAKPKRQRSEPLTADVPWHGDHSPGVVDPACPGCAAEFGATEPPEDGE